MRFLRFFCDFKSIFEKWSELGKIGKNREKCLAQNPHFPTTIMRNTNNILCIILYIRGQKRNAGYEDEKETPSNLQR